MSVDLTLMPILAEDFWSCHDALDLPRNYDAFDAIRAINPQPVPEVVSSHMAENGFGRTHTDPYGADLTWLPAGPLALILADTDGWKYQAAAAYLAKMPEDWPVVLYWH
jgi:hypothetical protein